MSEEEAAAATAATGADAEEGGADSAVAAPGAAGDSAEDGAASGATTSNDAGEPSPAADAANTADAADATNAKAVAADAADAAGAAAVADGTGAANTDAVGTADVSSAVDTTDAQDAAEDAADAEDDAAETGPAIPAAGVDDAVELKHDDNATGGGSGDGNASGTAGATSVAADDAPDADALALKPEATPAAVTAADADGDDSTAGAPTTSATDAAGEEVAASADGGDDGSGDDDNSGAASKAADPDSVGENVKAGTAATSGTAGDPDESAENGEALVGLDIQHEPLEHEIRYAAEDAAAAAAAEAARLQAEEEHNRANIVTPRLDQDKRINKFLDRVAAKTLAISVSDPREQRPKFGKPYVEYLVRTESEDDQGTGTDWMVRRRYSDFEWLRAVLKRKYVGMVLPVLPRKRNVKTFINTMRARTSGVFVRLRTRALNLFLGGLARIDFLKEDPDVKDFLEIQDDKEWDKTKKLKKDPGLFASFAETFAPSESVDVWRAAVTSFEQPPNWDRHLKDYKRQVEQLHQALLAVKDANVRLMETRNKTAAAVGSFCDGFDGVSRAEQQCGDRTRVEFANAEIDEGFVDLLGAASGALRDWQMQLDLDATVHQLVVHEVLKFHEAQVAEVLDLFARQEAADAEFKKETKELMKAKGKKEDMDMSVLQQKMDNAAKNFECCNKAFMFSEIDRFCVEKRRVFRELVATDSILTWTANNRFQNRWDAFIQKTASYCVGGDDTLVPDYIAKMKAMTESLPIASLMEAHKAKQ